MTTYEIDLPLHKGRPPLTMNQRLHWRQRAERTKKIRFSVAWKAKAMMLGHHEHVSVTLHFATGDMRRRDADNLVPTMKPAVDALVDADVVVDDDPQHVTTIMPIIHNGPGTRRLWITVHIAGQEPRP